jgi:hypothetical protein
MEFNYYEKINNPALKIEVNVMTNLSPIGDPEEN